MSKENLIERAERESGCRIDSNGHDNQAMDILFGAIGRALGKHNHREEDDAITGGLMRHQMSPQAAKQRKSDEVPASMLSSGADPDSLSKLLGGK